MKQNKILACRGYARPRLLERLARAVDRRITTCQEWLEGPDRPAASLAALAVILVSFVYIAFHLGLKVCRGG